MAKINWNYNYTSRLAPASKRYYNARGGRDDVRLTAFVIDHLNRSRSQVERNMSNILGVAVVDVKAKARVDTGRMRRLVHGTKDFKSDIVKISFGWKEWAPFYAPFQEFGTSNGITPMRAVHIAYRRALASTRSAIK